MLRLGDVIKSLGSATISVCGASVTVRALSALEHAAICAQAPDPPLLRGDGGTLDPQHPTTMKKRAERDSLRSALLVGAATGHAHPTLGPWSIAMREKEAKAYAEDVLASAAPHALQEIERAVHLLSAGVDVSAARSEADRIGTEIAQGNSSALLPSEEGRDGSACRAGGTA